ncbi:rhamnogalacturonan acetylesterase [Enterococcus ratti]|uniref:Rhamnogalacturonan acetylesterase n=1 Tax=Enterococcus ratti TaxID=150033 RepID=A0A1L8WRD6_9ENTE|nr:rhamnogalacturonan acetylesterase [Enterococcus ratti]OJG83372.1 rhamnogalacturonan acetylesterase [Enterococcus ratti]
MPTIHIAGDSTAAIKAENKRPETGWGEKLPCYFNTSISFNNQARNGRSTKSFLEEGRLTRLSAKFLPGDFLLVQFGHNDQKINEPKGTSPYKEYIENLTVFAQTADAANVSPIFLTPVTRRNYLSDGTLAPDCLGDYPQAMKLFARKNNYSVLDIFSLSQQLLRSFTQEQTKDFYLHLAPKVHKNYPNGLQDNTHFSPLGAEKIAYLIVQAIKKSNLSLAQFLKEGV